MQSRELANSERGAMNFNPLRYVPLLMIGALAGCANVTVNNRPNLTEVPRDEINIRPSLTEMVKSHPSLKVVLRVPNVTSNVTQSQGAQPQTTPNDTHISLDSAYDTVEKKLFKAGFVVRDRALLTNLLSKEGITSYKEIQSRVDTDLIIEISSLRFNEQQDWVTTKSYVDANNTPESVANSLAIGEAVATVEAKFIIVESGEVGAIVTLHVPLCEHITCTFDYDTINEWAQLKSPDHPDIWSDDVSGVYTHTYLWGKGSGSGSINQATDLIAQKIVDVLKR